MLLNMTVAFVSKHVNPSKESQIWSPIIFTTVLKLALSLDLYVKRACKKSTISYVYCNDDIVGTMN